MCLSLYIIMKIKPTKIFWSMVTHKNDHKLCICSLPYLEYIWEIPKVEDVVELYRSWEECGSDFLMEIKRSIDQPLWITLDLWRKALRHVASQDALVDGL